MVAHWRCTSGSLSEVAFNSILTLVGIFTIFVQVRLCERFDVATSSAGLILEQAFVYFIF